MDLNFFNKVRILDGGMGQELLSKGLIHHGTLWSASALIKEENHSLVIDTHNSFIEAGADVIVTNNFSARKVRLDQNNVGNLFEYINKITMFNDFQRFFPKQCLHYGVLAE